jgi:hypothetical protein
MFTNFHEARKNLCYYRRPSGEKYEKAKEWKVPAVSIQVSQLGPQSLRILAESVSTTVDLNPSALNMNPSVLDLNPSALDLNPSALDLNSSALDLNPSVLDMESSVLVLNLSGPTFIWPDWTWIRPGMDLTPARNELESGRNGPKSARLVRRASILSNYSWIRQHYCRPESVCTRPESIRTRPESVFTTVGLNPTGLGLKKAVLVLNLTGQSWSRPEKTWIGRNGPKFLQLDLNPSKKDLNQSSQHDPDPLINAENIFNTGQWNQEKFMFTLLYVLIVNSVQSSRYLKGINLII